MRRPRASTGASTCEEPAALFENPRDAGVELLRGRLDRELAVRGALGNQSHLGGDALPFRHFRRRLDAVELLSKRPRVELGGDGATRASRVCEWGSACAR